MFTKMFVIECRGNDPEKKYLGEWFRSGNKDTEGFFTTHSEAYVAIKANRKLYPEEKNIDYRTREVVIAEAE